MSDMYDKDAAYMVCTRCPRVNFKNQKLPEELFATIPELFLVIKSTVWLKNTIEEDPYYNIIVWICFDF